MSEILNTKKRDYQYNGQVDSSDYNARIEENYKDLVYLYNKASVLDTRLSNIFERVLKDHQFLSRAILDLEDRISALESSESALSIHSFSQFDYVSFVGSSYAIGASELLSFDAAYNVITLPKVSSSSFSKVKFFNQAAGQVIPDFFKAKIDTTFTGADTTGAVVDMTPIYNSVLDSPEKVWKRNIITDTVSPNGAQMMLYVKIPVESAGSLKTNMIKLNPYPMFSCDIMSVEYTTATNPTMTNADGWYPLNKKVLYDGDASAIGKVPPGAWSSSLSDAIRNSGPLAFIFPDIDITAIRIKFVQRNYCIEGGKYIYTYGLSDFDIRYDKYMSTGRTIIKYTPPSGIINEVTNVVPKIYNVPLSLLSSAFSYRVLYDVGSGNYSEDNPGASSSVWIEVTLNMLDDKTPPVLSDLIVEYN